MDLQKSKIQTVAATMNEQVKTMCSISSLSNSHNKQSLNLCPTHDLDGVEEKEAKCLLYNKLYPATENSSFVHFCADCQFLPFIFTKGEFAIRDHLYLEEWEPWIGKII